MPGIKDLSIINSNTSGVQVLSNPAQKRHTMQPGLVRFGKSDGIQTNQIAEGKTDFNLRGNNYHLAYVMTDTHEGFHPFQRIEAHPAEEDAGVLLVPIRNPAQI